METYRETPESLQHYQDIFSQHGKGFDIDRYIYRQNGTGLGSFFAKLARYVVPVAKSAFNIAKPHLKAAASELAKEGIRAGKRKFEKGAGKLLDRINKKAKLDELSQLE